MIASIANLSTFNSPLSILLYVAGVPKYVVELPLAAILLSNCGSFRNAWQHRMQLC